MPGKREEAQQGAPAWVLTYGDMMSLLLCFFIALVSMGEIKKDRFQQAVESLQRAFGGIESGMEFMPIETKSRNTLIEKLLGLQISVNPDKKGDTAEEGTHGKKFRVTNVPEGLQVVVGGRVAFDRFSAELKPEARALIAQTAERIRRYDTRVLVRGHATNEPLPSGLPYLDARDLSFARAKAIANILEENGVRRERILTVAAGDNEPLVRQTYSEEHRALNRRTEILVTEDLVKDYAGSEPVDELKGSADGN